MKTIAMIQNGFVVNTAAWDGSPWNPGEQFTLVDITNTVDVNGNAISIGWIYNGGVFSPPMGD